MSASNLVKPLLNEHSEYFYQYISLVEDDDILSFLKNQLTDSLKFFEQITEEKSRFRYADGKWSIKEVLGHIIDAEQIMVVRALRIARNDKTPLPGFDENAFVENAFFDRTTFTSLIELFIQIRKSTIALFRSFDNEAWLRTGTANNNFTSARTIPFVIAGHCKHHLKIISERYL